MKGIMLPASDKRIELYEDGKSCMERNDLVSSSRSKPLLTLKLLELLGEYLLKENRPEEAIAEIESCVLLNSRPARGYYLLATAYAELQRKTEAPAAINKCLEIQPVFKRATDLKSNVASST